VLPHHFASPDEIIKPVVQFKVEPEYSQEAREARINGRAVVWFIVGVDGVPSDIRVLEGLGYGLDENIVKAVERWRFTPAQRGGVPVRWFGKAEVNFQIPSS
jgi:TonB family protein